MSLLQSVEFGNAGDLGTHGTGWFVGFGEWTHGPATALRHVADGTTSSGPCIKYFRHPAGHPNGDPKPLSEGRTLSMLVDAQGEFRIEFSTRADFAPADSLAHTLRRHGDFVIWGPGIHHRAFGIQAACILTVRWA